MKQRTLAIVQARMGSERLPGKVLAHIGDASMLARVVRAARAARSVDHVVVATSVAPADDAVEAECATLSVTCIRGDEHDVLARFIATVARNPADVVVRLTADCPFLDPSLIDEAVMHQRSTRADYVSNGMEHDAPRGLDVEVFTTRALEQAGAEASRAYERSHVTVYIYEHPERFSIASLPLPSALANERWTVDTPEDLAFARGIAEKLASPTPPWREVLDVSHANPSIRALNRDISQKPTHEG